MWDLVIDVHRSSGGYMIQNGYLSIKQSIKVVPTAWRVHAENTGQGVGTLGVYAYRAFVS
jgi:hypothetical protein